MHQACRLHLLLFSLFSLSSGLSALPLVTDIETWFGSPGDTIRIHGTGFLGENLQVWSGTGTAPIENADAFGAEFTVPAGFTTGPLVLTDGDSESTILDLFWTLREVEVSLHESLSWASHVGSAFGDSASASAPYKVLVGKDRITLVVAAASEEEPLGLALILPDHESVEISPESTALAMVYLHPQVNDPTGATLAECRARLENLPGYRDLLGIYNSRLESRQSWTGTTGVNEALEILLEEYLRALSVEKSNVPESPSQGSYPQAEARFESLFSFENTTPRDLEKTNFEALERLIPKAGSEYISPSGDPVLTVKFDPGTVQVLEGIPFWDGRFSANPLDWLVTVYKLDPSQTFLDSPEAVETLEGSWSRVYDRLSATPMDAYIVPATLITQNLDPWGAIKKKILNLASPGNFVGLIYKNEAPKSQLEIPADESGIYMVRAFSGARMDLQKELVQSLPNGVADDWSMFKWNIIIGGQDFIFTMLGAHPSMKNREVLKYLIKVGGSSMGSIERDHIVRGETVGQSQALGIAKVVLDAMTDYALDRAKKSILPGANPTSKAAASKAGILALLYNLVRAGAKASERILAVTNGPQLAGGVLEHSYMAMSVEDTLVVVGDPWIPVVETFTPRRGHRGKQVRITGKNFSPVPGDNIVTFGALTTDPLNPHEAARAEVVSATEHELTVKIPEDARTGYITVAKAGGSNVFSTFDLKDPFKTFEVVGDPVIHSIFPETPRPSTKVLLRGENLTRDNTEIEINFAEGQFGQEVPILATRPYGVIVQIPNLEGANTVTITINGRVSNVFPFTSSWGNSGGSANWLWVNDDSDTNVRDGKLSLREAMMLANGELSVAEITLRPDNPPDGATYEDDQVAGQPGAETFDIIQVEVEQVTLSSPLPVVGSNDYITGGGGLFLETILNGASADAPGFLFDGTTSSQVTNFRLQNFNQPGLLFRNGASYNHAGSILIQDCKSNGVELLDDVFGNRVEVSVTGSQGHGILLSGETVFLNTLSTGYIEGGISENSGWGLKVENGASFNQVDLNAVSGNGLGGIHVQGETTTMNHIGPETGSRDYGRVSVINGNSGPGVLVEAPDTILTGLELSENQGHGIHLQSALAAGSNLQSVYAGFDRLYRQEAPLPNTGDGIRIDNGAHDIIIGFNNPLSVNPVGFPAIAGNQGNGITIDGAETHSITIHNANIGRAVGRTDIWAQTSSFFPNQGHGILISGGAHNVTISPERYYGVVVSEHENSDGIRIEGRSHDVSIVSAAIQGNSNGIVLADQAYGNRIGQPGSSFAMEVSGSTKAGIVLSSGLNPGISIPPGGDPFVPQGRNVVQATSIRNNNVGILLQDGAQANMIGGSGPRDGNIIADNDLAGIHVDGVQVTRAEYANRIEGNVFSADLLRTPILPPDPLTADPEKVGILITGGSAGNIIGGATPELGNNFTRLHHGIFIDGSNRNLIRNNDFDTFSMSYPDGYTIHDHNALSGVFIRNGMENVVGPNNMFLDCGEVGSVGAPAPSGGIWNEIGGGVVISGGGSNVVAGNLFGVSRERDRHIGNHPDAIQIHDSANNRIGGIQQNEPNAIVLSDRYGVFITGPRSSGNQIAGNAIGADTVPEPNPLRPNGMGGILIESGAADNTIGGSIPVNLGGSQVPFPAPNEILYNNGDGIRVDGAGSTGNRILDNSISDHVPGLGIRLTNGGNTNLSPPGLVIEDGTLRGTTSAPNGSLAQVFSDPVDEGAVFLGEAVVQNGTFELSPGWIPFASLTATVTDLNGNTSPFSVAVSPATESGMVSIERFGMVQERNIGTSGALSTAIPFKIEGGGVSVILDSLAVSETGSINGMTGIKGLMLYQDLDRDGHLSEVDTPISGPVSFEADNGIAVFDNLGIPVDPDQSVILILAAALTQSAAPGDELMLSLENASAVSFKSMVSSREVLEQGTYPIPGDTLVAVDDRSSDSFEQWLIPQLTFEEFQDPAFLDPDADFDHDGIGTLLEFLFQTNPFDPQDLPDIRVEDFDTNTIRVRFNHLDAPADVLVEFLAAYNLTDWMNLSSIPEVLEIQSVPSPIGGENLMILLRYPESEARVFLKVNAARQ